MSEEIKKIGVTTTKKKRTRKTKVEQNFSPSAKEEEWINKVLERLGARKPEV